MAASAPSACCRSAGPRDTPARAARCAGPWPPPRPSIVGSRRTYRPWQPVPGEHLVFDWGEEDGMQVFCAVLAWSRWRFVRFAERQDQATTLAPARGVLRAARWGARRPAHRPHGLSQGWGRGQRHGAGTRLCRLRRPLRLPDRLLRGRRPRDRRASSSTSWAMPSGPARRPRALRPTSDDANTAAVSWCAEVNGRLHSETRGRAR